MIVDCFARRIMASFQGVLQVIRVGHGEAARREFVGLTEREAGIVRCAGRKPRAAWFEREPNGAGIDRDGKRYPKEWFPRFLLTTHWSERALRCLADAFIDWTAPALLQLSHFDDTERADLECAVAQRVGVSARLFRLYPKTLDARLVRIARVQATIQDEAHHEEPFLWSK